MHKSLEQQKILHSDSDYTQTAFPTPITEKVFEDEEKKIEQIAYHFHEILQALGMDLSDPSLKKTPKRIAKTYVKEFFSGLQPKNFPQISLLEKENILEEDQMILIKDISIRSICEHHFVPMIGKAHIAYIPNKKIIGLSKIHRIADFFARRPQIQERLTSQILDCLRKILQTENMAILLNLKHFCLSFRGVLDNDSTTSTSLFKGSFKQDHSLKNEFLSKL